MTTQDSRRRFVVGLFCALLGAAWGCSVEKIDPVKSVQDTATATTEAISAATVAVKTVPAGQRIKLAFVTNNPSDFWKIAEAGVRKAAKEFDVDCEMQLPPNGTADDQQRIIEALIARGVAGMAISPNDADNQIGIINHAAEVMNVPASCRGSRMCLPSS